MELRCQTLKDRVDRMIAIQGTLTFTGLSKPIYPVPEFVHNFIVSDFPSAGPKNAWKREMWQRNQILRILDPNLPPDTLIMVSDVDEIPNPKDIPYQLEPFELVRFQHEFYHFNFNNHVIRDDSARKGWSCSALCRLDNLRKWYPQGIRNLPATCIVYSGWHFSWFHEPETKLKSYSHQELNDIEGDIPTKVQTRWNYRYERVNGLSHLPPVVQEHPERWNHYFAK